MEEEVTEYKKLNIYRRPSVAEREAVIKVTSAKDIRMEYGMHVFTGQDFRNMTSIKVWWEDRVILQFIMTCFFYLFNDYSSLLFNVILNRQKEHLMLDHEATPIKD